MREILFRGQLLRSSKWIYGSLLNIDRPEICSNEDDEWYVIKPETVGQFTGITDKNGVKIFEGDILKSDFGNGEPYSIRFGDFFDEWAETHFVGFYTYPELNAFGKTIQGNTDAYKVIGNIHDNPELL